MKIFITSRQKDLLLPAPKIRAICKELAKFLQIEFKELGVYFVSEKEISNIHKEFFDDPSVTDCMSFPIDDEYLGEIFICPKVAIDYTKKHSGSPLEETILYLVHGFLHLIGYDDLEPKERREMRKKEKECMSHLKSCKII